MMRKSGCLGVLCILSILCLSSADVVPPDQKPVSVCNKIVNLDKFPQYTLIAVNYSIGNQTAPAKTAIQKDSCLNTGYKFAPFCIYGTTRSYSNAIGFENLFFPAWDHNDSLSDSIFTIPIENLMRGTYVQKSDSLVSIEVQYSITSVDTSSVDSHFILRKTAEKHFFSGGTVTAVIDNSKSGPDSKNTLYGALSKVQYDKKTGKLSFLANKSALYTVKAYSLTGRLSCFTSVQCFAGELVSKKLTVPSGLHLMMISSGNEIVSFKLISGN